MRKKKQKKTANPNKPWVVLGVSQEARRIAKTMAKKDGKNIGEWLDSSICSYTHKTLMSETSKLPTLLLKDKPWWKFW